MDDKNLHPAMIGNPRNDRRQHRKSPPQSPDRHTAKENQQLTDQINKDDDNGNRLTASAKPPANPSNSTRQRMAIADVRLNAAPSPPELTDNGTPITTDGITCAPSLSPGSDLWHRVTMNAVSGALRFRAAVPRVLCRRKPILPCWHDRSGGNKVLAQLCKWARGTPASTPLSPTRTTSSAGSASRRLPQGQEGRLHRPRAAGEVSNPSRAHYGLQLRGCLRISTPIPVRRHTTDTHAVTTTHTPTTANTTTSPKSHPPRTAPITCSNQRPSTSTDSASTERTPMPRITRYRAQTYRQQRGHPRRIRARPRLGAAQDRHQSSSPNSVPDCASTPATSPNPNQRLVYTIATPDYVASRVTLHAGRKPTPSPTSRPQPTAPRHVQ